MPYTQKARSRHKCIADVEENKLILVIFFLKITWRRFCGIKRTLSIVNSKDVIAQVSQLSFGDVCAVRMTLPNLQICVSTRLPMRNSWSHKTNEIRPRHDDVIRSKLIKETNMSYLSVFRASLHKGQSSATAATAACLAAKPGLNESLQTEIC